MFSNLIGPISFALKMLFQVVLLFIFVYFFGIPSVKRYNSKEVLIVTTVIHPVKIHLPAVTVVAAASGLETLEKNCGESEDLRACVEESSPSLSETIHAELGFSLRESLMAPDLWRVDFTGVVPYGQSYTLVYPHLRGDNWLSDNINLHVNTSDSSQGGSSSMILIILFSIQFNSKPF